MALIQFGMSPAWSAEKLEEDVLPTISAKTRGMQEFSGFFRFWWDARRGQIWLAIDRFDEEFLYVNSLSTGLGSNPVGLDRGQLGQDRVVRFQRIGHKVLLQQGNLRYRARTSSTAERQAVADSFAQSVLWGTEVVAESEGTVLVKQTTGPQGAWTGKEETASLLT